MYRTGIRAQCVITAVKQCSAHRELYFITGTISLRHIASRKDQKGLVVSTFVELCRCDSTTATAAARVAVLRDASQCTLCTCS